MRYYLHLTLLLPVLLLMGCAKPAKENTETPVTASMVVYKRDREFTFTASHYNSKGNLTLSDTLIFWTGSEIINGEHGQTVSTWASPSGRFHATHPGVTENDTTVWLHPPRQQVYAKLELSPFPMVGFPLKVGKEWKWDLMVGGHYSVRGHSEWGRHNELFASSYRITREVPLQTAIGMVDCFEVEGKTDSRFGQTALRSYYSPIYGFVKLEYSNIDKGRIDMEMVAAKDLISERKLSLRDLGINPEAD